MENVEKTSPVTLPPGWCSMKPIWTSWHEKPFFALKRNTVMKMVSSLDMKSKWGNGGLRMTNRFMFHLLSYNGQSCFSCDSCISYWTIWRMDRSGNHTVIQIVCALVWVNHVTTQLIVIRKPITERFSMIWSNRKCVTPGKPIGNPGSWPPMRLKISALPESWKVSEHIICDIWFIIIFKWNSIWEKVNSLPCHQNVTWLIMKKLKRRNLVRKGFPEVPN